MNEPEADVIASAVSIIRPRWLKQSLMAVLRKQAHRPARQVALALIYLAYDPEVKTPGLLNHDGPWWQITELGESTYTPPAASEQTCRTHGDRLPCRGCAADSKALADNETAAEPIPRLPGESLVAWARRIAEHAPIERESEDE